MSCVSTRRRKYKMNAALSLLGVFSDSLAVGGGAEGSGGGTRHFCPSPLGSSNVCEHFEGMEGNEKGNCCCLSPEEQHIASQVFPCVFSCVTQQKSDREKAVQPNSSTNAFSFFNSLSVIPRKPVCWMDCVRAASSPHHSSEQNLADIRLFNLLVRLEGSQILLGTLLESP